MTILLLFRRSLFGALLFLFATMPWGSAHADDTPPTLETIIKAWKDREQKTESFDFRWRSKKAETPNRISPPAKSSIAQGLAPKDIAPRPENMSIWRYRFATDVKNRYFFEEHGHEWVPEKEDFVPKHTVELWDGSSFQSFYEKGKIGYPLVVITENQIKPQIAKNKWADPIWFAFRPFGTVLGMFEVDKLVLADETDIIDNTRVLILGDENRTVWVDPAKNYLPMRCASTSGDTRIEINYQPDKTVGWVPSSWTIHHLVDSETATVTQYSINKPIPNSEFEFDLRGGAFLQDNRKRPITLSIIYPDGKQRLLKQEELSKKFEELLKTESDSE